MLYYYYLRMKLTSTTELNFLKNLLFKTQNSDSKLFFKAIFSFSSVFDHWYGWEFYITLDWWVLRDLFEICLVLQSCISSFCQRLWVHLWDKYYWLTFLVSFSNGRFIFSNMSQFVILATRKGGADVEEGFLLPAVVTQWACSMFLMISSFEKSCIFF